MAPKKEPVLGTCHLPISKMAHDQEQNPLCWAFAASTLVRSALRNITGYPIPAHEVLVNELIKNFGGDCGQFVSHAIQHLISELKLPLKHVEVASSELEPYLSDNDRAVAASVKWKKTQYKRFHWFFQQSPDGVLNEQDFGPRDEKEAGSAHAVIICGFTPGSDGHFLLKNSWGSGWGDEGQFRVDKTLLKTFMIQSLDAVAVDESKLSADLWSRNLKVPLEELLSMSLNELKEWVRSRGMGPEKGPRGGELWKEAFPPSGRQRDIIAGLIRRTGGDVIKQVRDHATWLERELRAARRQLEDLSTAMDKVKLERQHSSKRHASVEEKQAQEIQRLRTENRMLKRKTRELGIENLALKHMLYGPRSRPMSSVQA